MEETSEARLNENCDTICESEGVSDARQSTKRISIVGSEETSDARQSTARTSIVESERSSNVRRSATRAGTVGSEVASDERRSETRTTTVRSLKSARLLQIVPRGFGSSRSAASAAARVLPAVKWNHGSSDDYDVQSRPKVSFKQAASAVGSMIRLRNSVDLSLRDFEEWERMNFRERWKKMCQNIAVCANDCLRMNLPALLAVILYTFLMCFVLEKERGGSLLSGFILYGRSSSTDIACDDFANMTSCIATDARGVEIAKTAGRTVLGHSIDMAAINSGYLVTIIASPALGVASNYLFWWGRCETPLLFANVVLVIYSFASVVAWAMVYDEHSFYETMWNQANGTTILSLASFFVVNSFCAPANQLLRSWTDVLSCGVAFAMVGLMITMYWQTLNLLDRYFGLAVLVLAGQLVFLITSRVQLFLLERLERFPTEATAAVLFIFEYGCLAIFRGRFSQIKSLAEVAYLSAQKTAIHIFGALCSLLYKRWKYNTLIRQNRTRRRQFLILLYGIDVLTDTSAQLLSILARASLRIAMDSYLYDIDQRRPCDHHENLWNTLASTAAQLVGELVVGAFVICAGQWLIGPHTCGHFVQTPKGRIFRFFVAALLLASLGWHSWMLQRRACIFCELQAQGETCS